MAPEEDKPAAPRRVTRDEREYRKLLEDYLGPGTGFVILLLCLGMHFSMENSEEIAAELAMNQDEQSFVIDPLARILDRQHFDDRVKGAIMNSGDMISLTLGIGMYGVRVFQALKTLQGGQIGHESRREAAQQEHRAGQNGNVPAAAILPGAYSQYFN